MNFPAGLFPDAWTLGAWFPLALVFAWSVLTAPWRRLGEAEHLHVWLGTVVALVLLWSMRAGVKPGLNLHLLGASAITLMFGRQLAVVGLALVLAGVTLNGDADLQAYALNAFVMVVFPVLLTHGLWRAVERWLPANFFVFVIVLAFFGAAFTTVLVGSLACSLLWLAGAYPAEVLWQDYLSYFVLLGFSEAWINGAVVTLLVVYFPHWVASFDDRRYLWNK